VGAPCFSRGELDFSPAEKRSILSRMGFGPGYAGTTNLNVPAQALQPRLTRRPPNVNILLRTTRTRIQRRLQIRGQHSVSRSPTNRTRFRL
jgi:hypothetical protein